MRSLIWSYSIRGHLAVSGHQPVQILHPFQPGGIQIAFLQLHAEGILQRNHQLHHFQAVHPQIARQRAKLEKNLGSIADLTRLPAALFVVDVQKEANAVKEAKRLSIPVFAMVDTCCDPTDIDYVIPANDDATKSIAVVLEAMCAAIAEGTEERKLEKEKEAQEADAEGATVKKEGKPRIKKAVKAAIDAEEAAVAEVVAAVETPYEEPAAAPAEAAETAEEKAE